MLKLHAGVSRKVGLPGYSSASALGRDDPLVRRAVAGYLTACPLASAKRHAAAIAAADPERWAAAVAATGLPPRAAD